MNETHDSSTAAIYPKAAHGKLQDLSGRVYGRITVISWHHRKKYPRSTVHYWLCRCVCNNVKVIAGGALTSGKTTSCGCYHREVKTVHGHSADGPDPHDLYGIWTGLRARCNNQNNKDYYRYGAVGITVCERWDSFEAFSADMGERPTPEHSIDRIDTHGPYSPENCRWSTKTEQSHNRGDNAYMELNGDKKLILEWAKIVGISYGTLWRRKKNGWSDERALTTPLKQ